MFSVIRNYMQMLAKLTVNSSVYKLAVDLKMTFEPIVA